MLLALIASVAATEPPPLDPPVETSLKSKKDAAAVIGNEAYGTLPAATGALSDATAMAEFLITTRGVPEERVHRVGNGSRSAMRSAIVAATREVKRGGTLWLYWAGHGALAEGGRRNLLGVEAVPEDLSEASLPLADVVEMADNSKAKQVYIIVDAGFGGRGRDGETLFETGAGEPPAALAENKQISIWISTTTTEPAFAWPSTGHGIYTYLVLGALRGWADGQSGAPDGTVTVGEAQAYVARLVRSIGGGEQKPMREGRAEVTGWTVSSGAREPGPSKEDLAALALSEKSRRVHKAEGRIRAVAAADWAVVSANAVKAGPESEATLGAFIAKYDTATVIVDGTEVAVAIPEVAEARARLDGFSRAARKTAKKKRSTKKTRTASTPTVAPTAACTDLVPLEPKALAGELVPDDVTCIEARISAEAKQTTRDKLSRMLIINADARGDAVEWERLVERHLEEVDRSDPDLCFKYALHLSRGDIENAPPVLRWTSYALENKHVWEGQTYISRVYNLLRLRAETATRLWKEAEADFLEDRSDDNATLAEHARGQAKDFAREWVDYARASGQPVDFALELCKSASGSPAFCENG